MSDGYKSGQKEYDSISKVSSGNTGTSNGTEQWWGYSDRVEQAREEIRAHREKFLKKHKLPRKTIRQIGEESESAIYRNTGLPRFTLTHIVRRTYTVIS